MYRLASLLFLLFISVYAVAADVSANVKSGTINGISSDYVLGAGDSIRIVVYGNPDLTTEARVNKAGTINFPLLGEVLVGGLTPAQAEKNITFELKKDGYVRDPHVNLIITQYLSQFVSVLGDVYKPGRFPLDRSTTLSDALALAGGINQAGSDIVTLTRTNDGKTTKYTFDVKELLASGQTSQNPKVNDGDIIYVPKAPVFYIYGEVQRPGSFKLERNMTVAQALSTGGGLTARGTENRIKIKRVDNDGELTTIQVELGDKLMENDVVVISESWF